MICIGHMPEAKPMGGKCYVQLTDMLEMFSICSIDLRHDELRKHLEQQTPKEEL